MSPTRGVPPRALAILLAVTALLLGAAPAAQAHDFLVGTSPADASTVAVVPAQVTLTFSEPALAVGTVVIVTGPTGPVETGQPVLIDKTIAQRLQPGSPAGRYRVTWRATSADGHPVSGTFSFSAAKGSSGGRATATPTTPTTSTSVTALASATPRPSAQPTPASADGLGALWWVAIGAVLLLLLLVAFIVLRARRTTSQDKRHRD
jgi:methionine-rich copper-binding protein CopC